MFSIMHTKHNIFPFSSRFFLIIIKLISSWKFIFYVNIMTKKAL